MASDVAGEIGPGVSSGSRALMRRVMDGELGGYVLLAPAMLVLLSLTVYPLLYSIYVSFTDYHLGSESPLHFIGVQNYVRMASDSLFLGSLLTTAKFLVVAVPLQLVFAYVCAAIFRGARRAPFARVFRTIFTLPTMITPLCIGLFWGYILDR